MVAAPDHPVTDAMLAAGRRAYGKVLVEAMATGQEPGMTQLLTDCYRAMLAEDGETVAPSKERSRKPKDSAA